VIGGHYVLLKFSCLFFWKRTLRDALLLQGPRDALCPSVVSFNSIIPRAESFIIVS